MVLTMVLPSETIVVTTPAALAPAEPAAPVAEAPAAPRTEVAARLEAEAEPEPLATDKQVSSHTRSTRECALTRCAVSEAVREHSIAVGLGA